MSKPKGGGGWRFLLFSFLLPLFLMVASPLMAAGLRYGIDMLDASKARVLKGKRVGLITNAASLSASGESDYQILLRHGVDLRFLMAPEHGFAVHVAAGEKVADTTLTRSLPVYSLYGSNRSPSDERLREVDILIFDLQDIGARCYTYISTMKEAMAACAATGTAFMVLDRPNPIAPLMQQGFMLDPQEESFVGAVNIPFVHAMTVGEIAMYLKQTLYPKLDLCVVTMEGWHRDRFLDEYPGVAFRSPSPNIPDVTTAMVYPSTVFLEATDISEGRGTDAPFMKIGAPFINPDTLAEVLNARSLPGVRFYPVVFTPTASKFKGQRCQGVQIEVTDRECFSPFMTGAAILLDLNTLYPGKVGMDRHQKFFHQLAGTSRFRQLLERRASLEEIVRQSREELAPFLADSPPSLYGDGAVQARP